LNPGHRQATAITGQLSLRRLLLFFFISVLPAQLSAQAIRTESFRGRDVVAGQIIVRYRDNAAPNALAAPDIVSASALRPSRAILLRSGSRNVSDLMQEYSGRPDVLYAEPNYIWHKNDVPNDIFFDSQWTLRNTGQNINFQSGVAGADIHAVQAWDVAQGSRSFVIGIVDSGVDYNHPDLVANIWSAPADFTVVVGGQPITCAAGTHGFNAIARTCDPIDDDSSRHGTFVSGIIGADGDNSLGLSGVSRVASMMALKFLGPDGSGNTADAIAAIEFAVRVKAALGVDANIRILNNSWGGSTFSLALLDAINSASSNDMLFVAAAGNDATNSDVTPFYPSGFNAPNIISVAATDNRDQLVASSNFGQSSVDLGAPGRDIASTHPTQTYVFETGTSMSAAVVSGAAGLVLSGCPGLTTTQLRANLISGVDVVPALQSKTASGGRLNVYNSLVNCAGAAPPSFTMKSLLPFILPNVGGSAVAGISVSPLNGFSSDVSLTASAPPGLSVSLASSVLTAGSYSTTLTALADANLAPGTYVIHVTGTSGNISRTDGLVFIVGSPISQGQNISKTWTTDASQPDRFRSVIPPGLADWHQFNLSSTTFVDIAALCFSFQGNALRLPDSSGAILVADTSDSNNILEITRTLGPGNYFIVVSANLSDTHYALALNAPLLRSLNPFSGEQGASVAIQLSGVQFASDITVAAGNEIAVSNVVFNQPGSASATFAIAPGAALGDHSVSVSTTAGISNSVNFTVVRQRPVITSISPPSGVVGTSVDITILGSGFIDPVVEMIASTASATMDNVVVVSTTTITARVTIPINSALSSPSIRITTLGGFTSTNFQILPLMPALTSISPSSGSLGSTVDVVLAGDNFFGPISVSAGSGITVSNVSIAFQSHTTVNARFTISPTTTLGVRNITVTTPGGTSGTFNFMVVPAPPPTLISISPANGAQSTTKTLDLTGTNFSSGLTFNADADIVVTSTSIGSSTQATITVQISNTARLGAHNVYLTTPGGTSNTLVFTVLIPPPTLTSISPSSGVQQSSVNMTLTGTNFVSGMAIQAGILAVSQISVISSTSATALVGIPVSTNTGSYNVTVATPSGISGAQVFTVLPGIPTLASITPTFGVRGRDTNVTLSGTNFASGSTTISPIPGVGMLNTGTSGGSIGATFSISTAAPLGPQNISITTPGGTTGPVTFTIYDPFPDLNIGSNATGFNLFAGLNGTYSVFLSNRGTAAATSMVVTDVLPPEFTFVSGGGNGFSCTASGQIVTCTYSMLPFTPQSQTFFTVTVAISANAPTSVTHTVSVPLVEDLFPADNTATATLTIQQVPAPTLTFSPSSLTAGQQANVSLSVPTRLPVDVTGTLTLAFSSSTSIPTDDVAIQFATGGRQVSYVIPANTLQARFGNASTAGPIGYQIGTVAGSFAFSGTAQIGPIAKTFASTPNSSSLTVAPTPPVIQPAKTTSQGGFALLVTSSSTSLSISEMVLIFNTSVGVQVSCGSAPGCTASGPTLTFDVKPLYDGWFATSSQFGSLSTLRLPLAIQGTVHGFVLVTLKNALGSSNTMSFLLP
jgi:uncharacterized repeat protein (TIGR01451 family)